MIDKTASIIETLGEIDETISAIVLAMAHMDSYPDQLEKCIYDLHDISAYIADYIGHISLHKQIREMEDFIYMKEVVDFTYPINHKAGAFLNMARSVARRAERALLRHLEFETYALNPIIDDDRNTEGVLKYMNRLSDYLFALSVDVRGL